MSAKDDANTARFYESKIVEIVGILSSIRKRSTKQKKMMASATLEDLQSTIELVVFPSVYQKYEHLLIGESIVSITGKVDIREGEDPQILVEAIAPFVVIDKQFDDKSIYVRVPKDMGDSRSKLIKVLKTSPGSKGVRVKIESTGENFVTTGSLKVTLTKSLINNLAQTFGRENIVVK